MSKLNGIVVHVGRIVSVEGASYDPTKDPNYCECASCGQGYVAIPKAEVCLDCYVEILRGERKMPGGPEA